MNPFLGVFLHSLGGLAAGSFYIPFKGVRRWAWESYWLVGGVFSWLVAPWVIAYLTCPDVWGVLRAAPRGSVFLAYLFGVLWGVGGLTFGLSMRYLGMSLGYALALGFCAAFGTLIPPLYQHAFPALLSSASGVVTLFGILVCLFGIAVCGRAGMAKERELSTAEQRATIREFDFAKGVWVAIFAGIMSSCMALGIDAGDPIAKTALKFGAKELWQNSPVFIVIMSGGLTTNFLWCVYLNVRNRTGHDYVDRGTPLALNYVLSALAGVTWYFQFMFYGMGTTQLGRYNFSSWTIHMAFIIVFSNLWGLTFREWKGASRKTHRIIFGGILILVASTLVIGVGNWLKSAQP